MPESQFSTAAAERAIAELISHRYGDGGIYFPRDQRPTEILNRAIQAGFVSTDGFITRKGRHLLARTEFSYLRG